LEVKWTVIKKIRNARPSFKAKVSKRLFEVLIKVLFAFFAKKTLSHSLLKWFPDHATKPIYSHHGSFIVVKVGAPGFRGAIWKWWENSAFVTEPIHGHFLVLLETVWQRSVKSQFMSFTAAPHSPSAPESFASAPPDKRTPASSQTAWARAALPPGARLLWC